MLKDHLKNFKLLMNSGYPEWIPFTLDIGAIPGLTEPVMKHFYAETGKRNPEEYFDYDFRTFSLRTHYGGDDPGSLHGWVEPGTTFDEWGIGHWAGGAEATYEKIYPPLARIKGLNDIESLPVPIIETPSDRSIINDYKARRYPVFGYAGSIYEWSWWLRGMENFMMDLVLKPVLAEALIQKVYSYTSELAYRSASAGIDVLCFYDDAGMQTGMQISPELWRKLVKPCWKKILDRVRSSFPNVMFFLHSCGNISEVVWDIVDLGFHILHPIQPECMDLADIKSKYGKNIVVCATISAQKVFPFGKPREVKNEVDRLKEIAGWDKRCILCPSNAVQPETPWENILAFVEEAKR